LSYLEENKSSFKDYLYIPVAIIVRPVTSYRLVVLYTKVHKYLKKEFLKSDLFEKKQLETLMDKAIGKIFDEDVTDYSDFHKIHYLAYVTEVLLWIRLHSGSSYEVKYLCSKIMRKIYENTSNGDLSYRVSATDKMFIDYNNRKFAESDN